jgi:hypothetical protein
MKRYKQPKFPNHFRQEIIKTGKRVRVGDTIYFRSARGTMVRGF